MYCFSSIERIKTHREYGELVEAIADLSYTILALVFFLFLLPSSFLIPIIPATFKHQQRRRGKSPFLIHTITLLHTNKDIFPLCWKKQVLFTWPLFSKPSLYTRTNKCWHMNARPMGDDKVYITVTSYTGEKHSEHTQLTFPLAVVT